jgi:hypothetical protein
MKYQESVRRKKEYHAMLKSAKKKKEELALIPPKPPFEVVLIPADCSGSKFVTHLADNQQGDCPAIMIESEIDTLTRANNSEWGNFSDMLRKAFHNEPVSMSRRADDEYIEVKAPKLAVALSGTMSQFTRLINNSEDGLYSRFAVYTIDATDQWQDVGPCDSCPNLTEFFNKQAEEYLKFYEFVSGKPFEVQLTSEQWATLNAYCDDRLFEITRFGNANCSGLVKRHGLIWFKLCMALSAFRKYETKNEDDIMVCTQEDFKTAWNLAHHSLNRSLELFKRLPGANKQGFDIRKDKFYQLLPDEFTTAEAVKLEWGRKVSERTIGRYLDELVEQGYLTKLGHGKYKKYACLND